MELLANHEHTMNTDNAVRKQLSSQYRCAQVMFYLSKSLVQLGVYFLWIFFFSELEMASLSTV